jgi:molecular chaperone Hsp33
VIVQALPGAEDAALALLEANVKAFGQLTDVLHEHSLQHAMEELTWGLGFELLTKEALPLQFRCRCSDEKALAAIAYFKPEEREEMIEEEGGAQVVCHWCGVARFVDADAIAGLDVPRGPLPRLRRAVVPRGRHDDGARRRAVRLRSRVVLPS